MTTETRSNWMLPRNVFHPSDFSQASLPAFIHALKIALLAKGKLTILHADSGGHEVAWAGFPKVRPLLERWGEIPKASSRNAVAELGLSVEKIATLHRNPVPSILDYLGRNPHDMIVLATHQHDGFDRILHRSIAEPVARRAGEMTLFIPQQGRGFVSSETGEIRLGNILIPIDHTPSPQVAIAAAYGLTKALGCHDAVFTLLHVGAENEFPAVNVPGGDLPRWRRLARQGDVESIITQAANVLHAGLIVMATMGHHGFLDALRGSTTERIVRSATCPVLAVPAERAETVALDEPLILQPVA